MILKNNNKQLRVLLLAGIIVSFYLETAHAYSKVQAQKHALIAAKLVAGAASFILLGAYLHEFGCFYSGLNWQDFKAINYDIRPHVALISIPLVIIGGDGMFFKSAYDDIKN